MENWLKWASTLQAIAQNGLHYTTNPFDAERYEQVREIAAYMLAQGTGMPTGQILDIFREGKGYLTPKIDVRGAVFQDNKILLVKERSDDLWTLPGGFADVNESPAEAVAREVMEESGYLVNALKLLAVFDKLKHDHPPQLPHVYKLFFLCGLLGGEPTSNIEISEIDFFEKENLPELSLPRVTKAQIFHLFDHYEHPDWPTDFD